MKKSIEFLSSFQNLLQGLTQTFPWGVLTSREPGTPLLKSHIDPTPLSKSRGQDWPQWLALAGNSLNLDYVTLGAFFPQLWAYMSVLETQEDPFTCMKHLLLFPGRENKNRRIQALAKFCYFFFLTWLFRRHPPTKKKPKKQKNIITTKWLKNGLILPQTALQDSPAFFCYVFPRCPLITQLALIVSATRL